ncbi:MAG: hemolysin family protein, partial [Bacteroidota bacterium]
MDFIILGVLIFLNALFSMSEIALVSARKGRLEHLAEKGNKRAQRALELSNHPELFLSAVQIGITLISILTGVYSGEQFSEQLLPHLINQGVEPELADTLATLIIVVLVTFVSIIFGELIPKRIGLIRAEKLAMAVAGPMRVFGQITYPFVWLLNSSSTLFFKIFKIRKSSNDAITEEEIKTLITEGAEAGNIEEEEQEIIERVFHLSDRSITSLMTHRSDIIWFSEKDTEEQIKEKIIREPHSAYP